MATTSRRRPTALVVPRAGLALALLSALAVGPATRAVEPVPPEGASTNRRLALAADEVVGRNVLFGLSSLSPDRAIAVGQGGGRFTPRARHWDGTRWNRERAPGGDFSDLRDLAVLDTEDIWAVGSAGSASLASHWDGHRWREVPTPPPDPDVEAELLLAVDGTTADDVWAVGLARLPSYQTVPLILHWDGTSWTKTDYRIPYRNRFGNLYGITMVSETDGWAVGSTYGRKDAPLILHWDGHQWTPETSILTPTNHRVTFRAVDAVAADDVWAVGGGGGPALVHWNGSDWIRHRAPGRNRSWSPDLLFGVSAAAPDDVWAVGGYADVTEINHIQILHWNGKRWRKVRAPEPGAARNILYAVSATGPDDAWAVGTYSDDGDTYKFLYLHWDGERWTRYRSPST